MVILGAFLAVLLSVSAPAAPGVFSLDRLRLGSSGGLENYLFTAGNVVYPEGGVDAGAYYKVVVTDAALVIRNAGFPCTPAAAFESTSNSYTIATNDPVSNSQPWKLTLQQFASSSCTGTPAKSAFKAFNVAKLTSWADSALTTQRSIFGAGASAYVTVAGMNPGQKDWTTTWITPSSSTACANTLGSDRVDADGFGRLPNTVGGYLEYRPATTTGPQVWNRDSNYEIRPCPVFGTANEGLWTVRLELAPTIFVVLPAFTVDGTAPPTPSIDAGPPDPSGSANASFSFSDSEQGAGFRCQLDGGAFAACTSPQAYTGLSEGLHTFGVAAVDAAGNVSGTTSRSWTIDTVAPDTSINSGPSGTVNSSGATFTFSSETGATFECELDGGGFAACTSPRAYTGLSEGAHTFRVRARDAAGNVDPTPAARSWTVDTLAPPPPSIDTGPPNPSGSTDASFTFSDSEAGVAFRCRLDGGSFAACTSPQAYSGLAQGAHTFQVMARDAAGNDSAASSYSWTIGLLPVVTLATPANGSSTNDSTPTYSGTAGTGAGDSVTVTVLVYSGTSPTGTPLQTLPAIRDAGGDWSVEASQALADGTYTAQAEQANLIGDVGRSNPNTFNIDTLAPPPPSIDTGPPNPSGSPNASFTFSDSEAGVAFRCRLDGGSFAACTSPQAYNGLAQGAHTFEVMARDAAGNDSAATSYSWTIDLPPVVTLATPANGSSTNDSTPTYSGTAGTGAGDSVTVTVLVYSGTSPTGTPLQTLPAIRDAGGDWSVEASQALADGTYTAQAEQADLGGNVGRSNPNTFTVTQGDLTPPNVVLSTPADGAFTNDATPTFAGTAGTEPGDLPTVTVNVYQGPSRDLVQSRVATADPSGAFAVDASPALAEGTYTAQAEQSDASGNVGRSADHTFAVDTTPPGSTIDSGPTGTVSSADATFTFSSEAGATFECELDGGGFAACTAPRVYAGLSEGVHTFRVRARDAAGNLDATPAARSWTVDTVAPPTPTINSAPPNPALTSTATFAFSDSESGVTLRCRLDGAGFANCTSPKTYSGLSDGQHTFEVVAVDSANNSSSDTLYAWTVDTVTPIVMLSSPANGSTTGDGTPPFAGTAGTAARDSTTVTVKVYSGTSPTGPPVQTLTATRDAGGAYSVESNQPLAKGIYTAQAEQGDTVGHTGLSSPATFTLNSLAYRREVLADSPRAYYRLGETTGTVVADEVGPNPGTYVNGVTLGQSGGLPTSTNTAASFDGVNDYVVVPHSSALSATTAVTVEAWAKRSRSGAWQVVVSKPGDGASKNENYSIWFNTLDKPVAFFGDGISYARVDGPVLDSNWHYLVATYDNATARIYVDGLLKASASSAVRLTANTLPLNIGRANANLYFFQGLLDDVAVYGTALSAARIQAHYDAATTFDATAPVVTLTSPANGLRTDDTTPTFSGTAGVAGGDSTTVSVKIYTGSTPSGAPIQTLTATRGGGGAYSVDASTALIEGMYTARAEQMDDSGNVAFSSANTFVVTLGDTAPPVVTLTSPANGSTTTDMTPAFSGVGGTAQGDSATVTIKIYAGTAASGAPVQTLTTNRDGSTGAYSVDSAFLDAFTYTARAQQSDAAGNVGLSAPTTFTIPSPYRAAVMADNPRAYWRLGELAGSTAADETGVNPATYNNVGLGALAALTGDRNAAASFDGLISYAIAADSNSLDASTGVTVAAWIKRTKGSVWQAVVGKPGDGASKNENYALWISPLDKAVGFFGNGSTFVRVDASAALDTNWHYIVATYDNATAKIYMDGVLQTSVASSVHLTANNLPLNIGRINAGGSFYGGLVDEVAIYGTALTVSQIDAHFNAANLFDTTAPVVTLSTPDQGSSTKDTTPAFAGMGATTSRDSGTITLRLYTGSTPTGTPIQALSASRFPTGAWGVSATTALADGIYTAQAEQIDASGNVGLSPARTFTVQANPPPSSDPVMIGAGDIGDCDSQGDEHTGLLLDLFPSAVVYTTGDNAYPNGTLDQFNNCFHPAWGVRAQARIRPAIGGHEYQTAQAAGYTTYFASQLAPFGPTASDWTKAYYSYDLGTWHVIVLNTECVGVSACSVPDQLTWARADLDAHPAPCTLAILPNPRFSSGDIHGNNSSIQPFWDLLNEKNVDVAVASDDHVYERFAPQDAQGTYDQVRGVREFVAGTGGSSHYNFDIIRANSEVRDNQTFGLLKFTLHIGRYEWEFVPEAGRTFTDSGSSACH